MEEVFAIKCKSCGGPMYSNQAKRSFECAYCGASEPWSKGESEPNSLISFRHKPLEKQKGLLKLVIAGTLQPPEEKELVLLQILLAQHVAVREDPER